jgi:hypothetical protein
MNTGKVQDRRHLRFAVIEDLLADIDRLVAADKAGKLRRTGNWTAGQAMGHIATWINYAYEGYPFKVPWFVKVFLRIKKGKYLRDGLSAGVRIPNVEGGTYGTEVLSTAEGTARLRQAVARLQRGELAKYESPAWGPMSQEARVQLNLRHAELHLSFQHPE